MDHHHQVCSAIQNQDFTVVQDYISGLKCHLFMQSRPDLAQWDWQSPPQKETGYRDKHLPKFGPFQAKRNEIRKKEVLAKDLTAVPPAHDPPAPNRKVPSVKDQIGKAVPRIGNYNSLNNKEQVVALVNDDLCINCGKCYMTCNDSGYQAISFDADTHIPTITEDCTGCTLCASVCPIPDCITMVPRATPYIPNRGISIA